MTTVYVVHGASGEYSDQVHWLTRAHKTEADARADVEFLTAKWAELYAPFSGPNDKTRYGANGEHSRAYKAIRRAIRDYDPNVSFGYNDDPSWSVEPVDLVD